MHRALLGLLVPVTLGLGACRIERNPEPAPLNADSIARAEIRDAISSSRDALLQGDIAAAAVWFGPEGTLHAPGLPDRVGSAQVRAALSELYGQPAAVTTLEVQPTELHIDGNLAFEAGTFEQRYRVGDGEQHVRGRYMARWRRGAEVGWRIERFLLNHYPVGGDTADPAPTDPDSSP